MSANPEVKLSPRRVGLLGVGGAAACLLIFAWPSVGHADLRAYWPLDEGMDTTTADLSGNGNVGTLVGDTEAGSPASPLPAATTPPAWITGVHGNALLFSTPTGVDPNYNHVEVSQSASLTDLGSAFTIALWIRQDSLDTSPGDGGGYQRVLSTPNYEIELGTSGDKTDYFWPYDGVNSQWEKAVGSSYLGSGGSPGEWYHMAVVYDGTNLKKYLNGALVANSVTAVAGPTITDVWSGAFAGSYLKLGSQTTPNKDWFIGALDDVAIWGDQFLTDDQIAGLYDGTLSPLSIPEPASAVLLLAALIGTIGWRRQR